MNNPYATPKANLRGEQNKLLVKKTKWKVFFLIIFILEIWSIISMISDPKETIFSILSDAVIYSAIIIGIFGFSFNKKIFNEKFWLYLIPVGLLFDIYTIWKMDWIFQSPGEKYFVIGFFAAIALPFMFFQYLGLFKYGYKSPEIWNEQRELGG